MTAPAVREFIRQRWPKTRTERARTTTAKLQYGRVYASLGRPTEVTRVIEEEAQARNVPIPELLSDSRRHLLVHARIAIATRLRNEQKWHPDSIAGFLNRSRTTVYYWLGWTGTKRPVLLRYEDAEAARAVRVSGDEFPVDEWV